MYALSASSVETGILTWFRKRDCVSSLLLSILAMVHVVVKSLSLIGSGSH